MLVNDLSLLRLRGLAVDSSAIKEEMRFSSFHCFFLLLEKEKQLRMIETSSGEEEGEVPSISLTISRIFDRCCSLLA